MSVKTENEYNMIDWFVKCMQNYANFNGRARRKEYWFFILVQFLITFVIGLVLGFILPESLMSIINIILSLVFLVPSLAVGARRLHDIGKSGWFLLLGLIPLVGAIILIVFFCLDTKRESNQWGEPAY